MCSQTSILFGEIRIQRHHRFTEQKLIDDIQFGIVTMFQPIRTWNEAIKEDFCGCCRHKNSAKTINEKTYPLTKSLTYTYREKHIDTQPIFLPTNLIEYDTKWEIVRFFKRMIKRFPKTLTHTEKPKTRKRKRRNFYTQFVLDCIRNSIRTKVYAFNELLFFALN